MLEERRVEKDGEVSNDNFERRGADPGGRKFELIVFLLLGKRKGGIQGSQIGFDMA